MLQKYNSDGLKYCNNCKEYHHPWVFGVNNSAKDGFNYSCRESINEKKCPKLKPNDSIVIKPILPNELMNLKLTTQYKYKRPDAYDIYINNINYSRK